MKKYISEIFLTTDNVKEKSWLELIYAISNFNKLFLNNLPEDQITYY